MEHRDVRIGYADPQLKGVADSLLENLVAETYAKANAHSTERRDMSLFIALNGCASPVTKRFQENLIRFGSGRPPLVVAGAAAAKPPMKVDQNDRRGDMARVLDLRSLPDGLRDALEIAQFNGWETDGKLYANANGSRFILYYAAGKYSKEREAEFLFDEKGQSLHTGP